MKKSDVPTLVVPMMKQAIKGLGERLLMLELLLGELDLEMMFLSWSLIIIDLVGLSFRGLKGKLVISGVWVLSWSFLVYLISCEVSMNFGVGNFFGKNRERREVSRLVIMGCMFWSKFCTKKF